MRWDRGWAGRVGAGSGAGGPHEELGGAPVPRGQCATTAHAGMSDGGGGGGAGVSAQFVENDEAATRLLEK